jgi:hypothetical protein
MDGLDAFLMRTVGAAVAAPASFHAVADYFTATVLAFRCQGMNGALKAVEVVRDSIDEDFDGLVVLVSTDFTVFHNIPL